jgi:YHYH protein
MKTSLRSVGLCIVSILLASNSASGQSTVWPSVAGVKAAKWGSHVKISYADTNFTFTSDGIPNHARDVEYVLPNQGTLLPTASTSYVGADPTKAQSYAYTIPLNPTKAAKTTSTGLGVIGVMISGAALFNAYEGDGTSVATADNFSLKNSLGKAVWFIDSCNAHPTPQGQYHYHALPKCITSTVDVEGGPSHIIGFALDGFPIYGDRALDGSKILASQLDPCNGIISATPEFPLGIYHYVLLNTTEATSSLRCFSGTVTATGMPGMGGMPMMPGMPGMLSPPSPKSHAILNTCTCVTLIMGVMHLFWGHIL